MVDDEGATLASGVVAAVRERYPQVGAEVHPAVRGKAPYTTVIFSPTNEGGVEITLYANWDYSFDLHVADLVLWEFEQTAGSIDERIEKVANAVLDCAESGVRSRWMKKPYGTPWS